MANKNSKDPYPSKILHVDDHPILHKAIRGIILDAFPDSEFIESSNAKQTIEIMEKQQPDFVIIDLNLNGTLCFSLIRKLHKDHPYLPILVFSMYEDFDSINSALKAGASGYITKQDSSDHIIQAIRSLMRNRRYLSDRASSAIVHYLQEPAPEPSIKVDEKLTRREMEVFELLGKEYPRKEIASKLHVSLPTIDTHIDRMKNKLGFESSYKLICFALKYASQSNNNE